MLNNSVISNEELVSEPAAPAAKPKQETWLRLLVLDSFKLQIGLKYHWTWQTLALALVGYVIIGADFVANIKKIGSVQSVNTYQLAVLENG